LLDRISDPPCTPACQLVNWFNYRPFRRHLQRRIRAPLLLIAPAALLSLFACAHAAEGRDGGAHIGCGAVTDGRGAEVSGRAGGTRIASRLHRECPAAGAARTAPGTRWAPKPQTPASQPVARAIEDDAHPIRSGPVNLPKAVETPSAVQGDLVRAGATVVTGGALIWLVHSGLWASLLLLGVPIWRHVDLLPIVTQAPGVDQAENSGALELKEDFALVRMLDGGLAGAQGGTGPRA
jgi:hypothetical protein